MDLNGKKIILASNSPRRKELLKGLDIDFEVDTKSNFKEDYNCNTDIESIPAMLSEGKSTHFHRELQQDEILITSDTMVICEGQILGKPHDYDDAFRMLKLLSGKKHKVITGVTIRDFKKKITFSDTSIVFFKELSNSEIEYYLNKYQPYDKAGSYGIQEWIGYTGITHIEGSFYTIMGFPVHRVYSVLQEEFLK